MTMIGIGKMTMVIFWCIYWRWWRRLLDQIQTHCLYVCHKPVFFTFYSKIFWRWNLENFFLLIISFVVILIRIFDRHAMFHAYVWMKESFFLFPSKKTLSMLTSIRQNLSARKIRVWVIRENMSTRNQRNVDPQKYVHAKMYLPKLHPTAVVED